MVFVRDDGSGDTDMVIGARPVPEDHLSPEEEAELVKEFRRRQCDDGYITERYEELRRRHPRKFVGVYNRQIIGIEEELETLLEKANESGVPRGKLVTAFLLPEDTVWAL